MREERFRRDRLTGPPDQARKPGKSKLKDTKKWCKGVEGRFHKNVWVLKPSFGMANPHGRDERDRHLAGEGIPLHWYGNTVCQTCGKKMNYSWNEIELHYPLLDYKI